MIYLFASLLLVFIVLYINQRNKFLRIKNDIAIRDKIETTLKDNRNKEQKREKFDIMYNRIGNKEVILLVDDEESVLDSMKDFLNAHNFTIKPFSDPLIALEYFKNNFLYVDVIITDYSMPHMEGIDFIKKIKEFDKNKPVIVFTGYSYVNVGEDGKKLIDKYFSKPISPTKIVEGVFDVLDKHKKQKN